jgi:D-beta-D-heptose 7-phosphate kinase/D-beta-D-heptose 1-phosphate adenosyltransferase
MNLINNSQNKTLVIGDLMLDHYMFCSCERISPEAPVPVANLLVEEWKLGGAANVANNLIQLGVNVFLCGVVGNDSNGIFFIDQIIENKIESLICELSDRKTTVKSRVVSGGQQLLRIDREDTFLISQSDEDLIISKIRSVINECNCIIISDYNKGLLTEGLLNKICELKKKFKITILVDPKVPPFIKFTGVDLIKPNKREAYLETGIEIKDEISIKNTCMAIFEKTKIPMIVITLSEGGVAIFENGQLSIIPTKTKEVFDVTGAGDTFIAALSYKYSQNYNLSDSCAFANFAAACVISKMGSATTNLNEIHNLINNEINGGN